MLGFLRRRLGTVPAELAAELAAQHAFFIAERVPVHRHFSGHVPGVFSSTGVARYIGAIALTPARVLATLPTAGAAELRAIDCPWEATGPGRVAFDADGVRLDIDLHRVDPAFSGDMSIRYRRALPNEVLDRLPARNITVPVDPVLVYRAAGVRPRP